MTEVIPTVAEPMESDGSLVNFEDSSISIQDMKLDDSDVVKMEQSGEESANMTFENPLISD